MRDPEKRKASQRAYALRHPERVKASKKKWDANPSPDRREYLKNYQREWMQEQRAAFFVGKMCAQCGATENLELDHIDRTKKERRGDHAIWSWTKARRDEELKKCQVLCSSCHRRKSAMECRALFTKPLVHGTLNAYREKKCKCDLCRENYNAWRRARRKFYGGSSMVEPSVDNRKVTGPTPVPRTTI